MSALSTGTRTSLTVPTGGVDLRVHLAVPATLGPGTRVVVVMHGTERDAREYCDAWTGWAGTHDRLVVCPEFDRESWPGARSYVLGNVFTAKDGAGELRAEQDWSFTAVVAMHRAVRAAFGLTDRRFDLWGHSAGAQFVHRFTLFRPEAPVRLAIAANSGWYTLPDLATAFPYGLRHPLLSFTPADVARWAGGDLVLMRGERDVLRDEHLRTAPGADAQGPSRYHRAARMLRAGHAASRACRWRLVDVPGAGHDHLAMAPVAQQLLT